MKRTNIIRHLFSLMMAVANVMSTATLVLQPVAMAQSPEVPPSWSITGSLNTARRGYTATLLPDGKVLVAGGFTSPDYLNSAELYDPAIGTWSYTDNLNRGRTLHTATLLPNGKVLVLGGEVGTDQITGEPELYDPDTHAWSVAGNLYSDRIGHTATLLPNGKVLVAGGCCGATGAELYDPATTTWTVTGSLNTARWLHTAILLPSGKVLVAGGLETGTGYDYLNSAELYDPATGTWSPTGNFKTGRDHHTATLLPNGKVLIAGGESDVSDTPISSAELYDSATGTWSVTGSLNTARGRDHTATPLHNDKGQTGMLASAFETTVNAKAWKQIGMVLAQYAAGTTQGYARVTRIAGNNPFIAYAVVNDGGQPGERTGDGAFVTTVP